MHLQFWNLEFSNDWNTWLNLIWKLEKKPNIFVSIIKLFLVLPVLSGKCHYDHFLCLCLPVTQKMSYNSMLCWKPTQLAFKKYCIYLSYKCIIKTVPTFLHAISKKDTIEEITHFHPIPMFFLFVFNCSMYPKTAVWCKVKLVS